MNAFLFTLQEVGCSAANSRRDQQSDRKQGGKPEGDRRSAEAASLNLCQANHPCLCLQVHALQCDVRDPQAVSRCVDEMEKLTGLPDVKTTKSTHKHVGDM